VLEVGCGTFMQFIPIQIANIQYFLQIFNIFCNPQHDADHMQAIMLCGQHTTDKYMVSMNLHCVSETSHL